MTDVWDMYKAYILLQRPHQQWEGMQIHALYAQNENSVSGYEYEKLGSKDLGSHLKDCLLARIDVTLQS